MRTAARLPATAVEALGPRVRPAAPPRPRPARRSDFEPRDCRCPAGGRRAVPHPTIQFRNRRAPPRFAARCFSPTAVYRLLGRTEEERRQDVAPKVRRRHAGRDPPIRCPWWLALPRLAITGGEHLVALPRPAVRVPAGYLPFQDPSAIEASLRLNRPTWRLIQQRTTQRAARADHGLFFGTRSDAVIDAAIVLLRRRAVPDGLRATVARRRHCAHRHLQSGLPLAALVAVLMLEISIRFRHRRRGLRPARFGSILVIGVLAVVSLGR